MDWFTAVCWVLVIALVAFLYWFVGTLALKYTAHRRTGSFWFIYHMIPRRVRCPELSSSQYWDRFPNARDLAHCPTIDDTALLELADTVRGKTRFMTERGRARYVLAMVQQNVTYRTDSSTFGRTERYCLPVCTMYLRGNDCEDSAFLGAGLCKLLGMDVAVIRVTGHVAYGVAVKGWGTRFIHNDREYVWCESTGIGPLGFYTGNQDIQEIQDVEAPSEDFLTNGTYQDGFAQYKK